MTYDELIDPDDPLPLEPPSWYDDELPSIEELCRQQGVKPMSLQEALGTRPVGTPEEEERFARAIEQLRKERW